MTDQYNPLRGHSALHLRMVLAAIHDDEADPPATIENIVAETGLEEKKVRTYVSALCYFGAVRRGKKNEIWPTTLGHHHIERTLAPHLYTDPEDTP